MGQRLNIEIIENGEVLANAYYHWSGFTSSALTCTKMIMDVLDDVASESSIVKAIKLLEATGAGLTQEELEEAKSILGDSYESYDFQVATNRNEGLIAISAKGIEDTRRWEEAGMYIDLTNQTIAAGVFWELETEDLEELGADISQLPASHVNLAEIRFDEFHEFYHLIENAMENGIYHAHMKNADETYVIGFIA